MVLSIALNVLVASVGLTQTADHAAFHLATALPMLLMAWSIAYWCPPRRQTRTARWGRRLAIVGLVMVAAGLVLEAIGAFGYNGDSARIEALATLHNTAWLIQLPGLPLLLAAVLMGLASLFQKLPNAAQPAD